MIDFIEDNEYNYASRTKKNIQLADATIDICIDPNTAGEKLTKKIALEQGKPFLQIVINRQCHTLKSQEKEINNFITKISKINNLKLNIAGNGLYTLNRYGITQSQANNFVYQLITLFKSHNTKIQEIRSGGQTGFDEAGLIAADKHNIKTICLAPKGWRFRDINNKDITNKEQFISRFNIATKKETKTAKQVTMYTSYWFNPKFNGMYGKGFTTAYIVQISVSIPKGLYITQHIDYKLDEATPDWSTVDKIKKGIYTEADYYAEYIRKLFNNKQALREKLVDIYRRANGRMIVFFCWETPDKFCHRHIFAEWATKQFRNLTIKEIK